MKRIDYEIHNEDEWKIVYRYKKGNYWIHGCLFKKRKNKKWYEKTWEYINEFSTGAYETEKPKDLRIKEYYEEEDRYEKLKQFFKNKS